MQIAFGAARGCLSRNAHGADAVFSANDTQSALAEVSPARDSHRVVIERGSCPGAFVAPLSQGVWAFTRVNAA